MKKFLLFLLWLPITLVVLIIALFSLSALNSDSLAQSENYEFYAAIPSVLGSFTSTVQAADSRPELIKRYLDKYKSPLLPYSDLIVQLSDKYSIDFRLIVSIAQCESNICKVIPEGSYNCWGFENGATHFNSWEHALERVAKTMREGYYDYGLITPEQIMPKYAPPSVAKGGPWAKCVRQFMDELQ